MADVRRLPVALALVALVVAGSVAGRAPAHNNNNSTPAAGSLGFHESVVSTAAISSSWSCAGATEAPGSVASGELVFSNGGSATVAGTVDLVSQEGYRRAVSVSLPPGSTRTLQEELPGVPGSRSDQWLGAIVTLYGGMATVTQVVSTPHGTSSQPCASAGAREWYFADGATLRNAWDEISLVNPYPVTAVADLSFTTEQGRELPMDFQGVVVPPDGLTILDLGSHLRRRQHIAVTVSARTGEFVAYQTEIVTPPPPGAPPRGAPGAVNPVIPVPGITLALGSTVPSTSQWWPAGGEGPGITESYAVYNPGQATARLTLDLASPAGARSTVPLTIAPYGSAFLTTNGAPWALPGIAYSAHLESTDGVGVVAERFVMDAPPSAARGLGVLYGESTPASGWLLVPASDGLMLSGARVKQLARPRVEVLNPGEGTATVSVQLLSSRGGAATAPTAATEVRLAPGGTATVQVPESSTGGPFAVRSSAPVLVEQDLYSLLRSVGSNLSPLFALRQT